MQIALDHYIPDATWRNFSNFNQIKQYIELHAGEIPYCRENPIVSARTLRINMPQMSLGGLSESWLFKEVGDLHWSIISKIFYRASSDILNENGDRLYATFVRVKFELTGHLKQIKENDFFFMQSELQRFGKLMYYSKGRAQIGEHELKTHILSAFSLRGSTSNKSLFKSEPVTDKPLILNELSVPPGFFTEYKAVKRNAVPELNLGDHRIKIVADKLFVKLHDINPYYELNGVNLLYFASYPLIHEMYEREFMNSQSTVYNLDKDWAAGASTISKDVFYFSNCDITDKIMFVLNSVDTQDNKVFKISSSLYRTSDNTLLARIFSIKALHL